MWAVFVNITFQHCKHLRRIRRGECRFMKLNPPHGLNSLPKNATFVAILSSKWYSAIYLIGGTIKGSGFLVDPPHEQFR